MGSAMIRKAIFVASCAVLIASVAVAEQHMVMLPRGAIIAFHALECPRPDWIEYKAAKGRVMVGAGPIPEAPPDMEPVHVGKEGGHYSHTHGTGGASQSVRRDRGGDNPPMAPDGHRHTTDAKTNMQPYLGVLFCVYMPAE